MIYCLVPFTVLIIGEFTLEVLGIWKNYFPCERDLVGCAISLK